MPHPNREGLVVVYEGQPGDAASPFFTCKVTAKLYPIGGVIPIPVATGPDGRDITIDDSLTRAEAEAMLKEAPRHNPRGGVPLLDSHDQRRGAIGMVDRFYIRDFPGSGRGGKPETWVCIEATCFNERAIGPKSTEIRRRLIDGSFVGVSVGYDNVNILTQPRDQRIRHIVEVSLVGRPHFPGALFTAVRCGTTPGRTAISADGTASSAPATLPVDSTPPLPTHTAVGTSTMSAPETASATPTDPIAATPVTAEVADAPPTETDVTSPGTVALTEEDLATLRAQVAQIVSESETEVDVGASKADDEQQPAQDQDVDATREADLQAAHAAADDLRAERDALASELSRDRAVNAAIIKELRSHLDTLVGVKRRREHTPAAPKIAAAAARPVTMRTGSASGGPAVVGVVSAPRRGAAIVAGARASATGEAKATVSNYDDNDDDDDEIRALRAAKRARRNASAAAATATAAAVAPARASAGGGDTTGAPNTMLSPLAQEFAKCLGDTWSQALVATLPTNGRKLSMAGEAVRAIAMREQLLS